MAKLLLNRYMLFLLFLSIWSPSASATINHAADDYQTRDGVSTIVAMYNQMARQVIAVSHHNLGAVYANGNGVEQDYTKAFEWFYRAADQGFAISQQMVGVMYANGNGIAKDLTQAFQWFNKAATSGNAIAMANLADWYHQGVLGKRNLLLAHVWFDLAGRHGLEEAHQHRDNISQLLPHASIHHAKEIANQWNIGQAMPDIAHD